MNNQEVNKQLEQHRKNLLFIALMVLIFIISIFTNYNEDLSHFSTTSINMIHNVNNNCDISLNYKLEFSGEYNELNNTNKWNHTSNYNTDCELASNHKKINLRSEITSVSCIENYCVANFTNFLDHDLYNFTMQISYEYLPDYVSLNIQKFYQLYTILSVTIFFCIIYFDFFNVRKALVKFFCNGERDNYQVI